MSGVKHGRKVVSALVGANIDEEGKCSGSLSGSAGGRGEGNESRRGEQQEIELVMRGTRQKSVPQPFDVKPAAGAYQIGLPF